MDAIYEVRESQEEQESTRQTVVSNAHRSSTSQITITKANTHEPLLSNRPVSVQIESKSSEDEDSQQNKRPHYHINTMASAGTEDNENQFLKPNKQSMLSQSQPAMLKTIQNSYRSNNNNQSELYLIKRKGKQVSHMSDGIAVRNNCCFLFSLYTGVSLMVLFDLASFLGVLWSTFNSTEDKSWLPVAAKVTIINQNAIQDHYGLYAFCFNAFIVGLYGAKLLFGCNYLWRQSFPPEQAYEFKYRGKTGYLMWKVQRVKQHRKRLLWYFIASTVAVFFVLLQQLVINTTFLVFIDNFDKDSGKTQKEKDENIFYRSKRLLIIFILSLIQIFYILRKQKAHLKELDRLVTVRYEELQTFKYNAKVKMETKVAKRKGFQPGKRLGLLDSDIRDSWEPTAKYASQEYKKAWKATKYQKEVSNSYNFITPKANKKQLARPQSSNLDTALMQGSSSSSSNDNDDYAADVHM